MSLLLYRDTSPISNNTFTSLTKGKWSTRFFLTKVNSCSMRNQNPKNERRKKNSFLYFPPFLLHIHLFNSNIHGECQTKRKIDRDLWNWNLFLVSLYSYIYIHTYTYSVAFPYSCLTLILTRSYQLELTQRNRTRVKVKLEIYIHMRCM